MMVSAPSAWEGKAKGMTTVGKPTNGPDWTDVATMMSALESLHECSVSLTVITGGQGHNGRLTITMLATFAVLPGTELARTIVVSSTWPCVSCRELAAHVYGGLYKLDFAIGEAYQQRFLPDT